MIPVADREELQSRRAALTPARRQLRARTKLVLVEYRHGALEERSRWFIERTSVKEGYLLSSGRWFSYEELIGEGHMYFYVLETRWDAAHRVPKSAPKVRQAA